MNKGEWKATLCMETPSHPGTLVIFGAAGDLATQKLYPSLFRLHEAGVLAPSTRIIGAARREWSDARYREHVERSSACSDPSFLHRFSFADGDFSDPSFYASLAEKLKSYKPDVTFHLALPPEILRRVIPPMAEAGLLKNDASGWRHAIFEKPFGRDLADATELELFLRRYLAEDQIYRIDHYLGKDTVQNILMTRFANIIFEPVWNRNYIDSVTIKAEESIGIGTRAPYYDKTGQLRDMFQNHLLELLALTAMELPSGFDADALRDEKLKLIRAIRPFAPEEIPKRLARGQYASYRSEPGVAPDSKTETLVDGTFFIDNWRWNGVPFRLRSGKKLEEKRTEIVVHFKEVPQSIFAPLAPRDLGGDLLVFKIQPEEGVDLTIQAKFPGPKLCFGELTMKYSYPDSAHTLDAYARLLLDAMAGDQTLFPRSDVIRASWELFTPVLEFWNAHPETPLTVYPDGDCGILPFSGVVKS